MLEETILEKLAAQYSQENSAAIAARFQEPEKLKEDILKHPAIEAVFQMAHGCADFEKQIIASQMSIYFSYCASGKGIPKNDRSKMLKKIIDICQKSGLSTEEFNKIINPNTNAEKVVNNAFTIIDTMITYAPLKLGRTLGENL